MDYQAILVEQLGPVARIWHNRPDAANAESLELLEELDHAIGQAGADDSVRVIILGGKGKHFSSGHDLRAGWGRPANTVEERWTVEEQYYWDYCMHILNLPKPTIAQVQGAAIAGGFMVANMCDLIVASDDAYFADPVIHSLGAAAVEILIHPWVLGTRKAKELLFTGERISAQEAQLAGMVNRVVARERLEEETLALANKIAEAPPFTLKLIKRSLNHTQEIQGLHAALNAHFDLHELSHATETQKQRLERGAPGSLTASGRNILSRA